MSQQSTPPEASGASVESSSVSPSNRTPPLALSDAELAEVEQFARNTGLDEIGRLCAELRAVRAAYLQKCREIARMRSVVATVDPDPHSRYSKELQNLTGETDAP